MKIFLKPSAQKRIHGVLGEYNHSLAVHRIKGEGSWKLFTNWFFGGWLGVFLGVVWYGLALFGGFCSSSDDSSQLLVFQFPPKNQPFLLLSSLSVGRATTEQGNQSGQKHRSRIGETRSPGNGFPFHAIRSLKPPARLDRAKS